MPGIRQLYTMPANRRGFLIRKCLIVLVVFVLTTCNLYFKGKTKRDSQRASELNDVDTVGTIDELLAQDAPETKIEIDNAVDEDNSGWANTLYQYDAGQLEKDFGAVSDGASEETRSAESSYHTRRLHSIIQQQMILKSGKIRLNTNKTSQDKSKQKPPVVLELFESNSNSCTNPAYMEFPPDIFGQKARTRGAVIFHIAIVCYMFYALAVVCDHYFLPSLEACAQRLNLSEDVAGATFMAAGSSAPELFTAILGVFIAKGDVGTGTIVGSAVFNILFVIGLCSLYTVSTELNWWPVARDSSYYTFTVLVLIVCIYDGKVTTFESFILLVLYCVYIAIMNYNIQLRDIVYQQWQLHFPTKPVDELNNINSNAIEAVHYQSFRVGNESEDFNSHVQHAQIDTRNPFVVRMPEVTVFEAANQIIIKYKRLFRPITRFRSAAYLVIIRSRKAKEKKDNFYHDLNHHMSTESRKLSKIGPEESFWRRIPDPNVDGLYICAKWLVVAPLHAALFYTIPDCKVKGHLFLVTFFASITWTAIFSYIMVWMVTLIGFTFGIPDSIMGITFLAAGTSVPDAYASIHVAKMGQADMAVSNSIGSNVFDILVGLALPWFVETALVNPGSVSSINSQGLVYAVVLLFLSLLITLWLFHVHRWTLNPHLGYSLLATYAGFLVFSSALEFNLFGKVNPSICGE